MSDPFRALAQDLERQLAAARAEILQLTQQREAALALADEAQQQLLDTQTERNAAVRDARPKPKPRAK